MENFKNVEQNYSEIKNSDLFKYTKRKVIFSEW